MKEKIMNITLSYVIPETAGYPVSRRAQVAQEKVSGLFTGSI